MLLSLMKLMSDMATAKPPLRVSLEGKAEYIPNMHISRIIILRDLVLKRTYRQNQIIPELLYIENMYKNL